MTDVSRLIPPETRTLIVPIDHGLDMGNVSGLEEPSLTLQKFAAKRVNGTLMSVGLARRLRGMCEEAGMSLTIPLDFHLLGTSPGDAGTIRGALQVSSVDQAVGLGADGVKLLFPWGVGDEVVLRSVQIIATIAEDAHRLGIPLMIEPLWFGKRLNPDEHTAFVVHAARIALELGADVLKVPVVDAASVATMVGWGAPVVFLGGAWQGNRSKMLAEARAGIEAGASGVVVGRNIWQAPDVGAAIDEFRELLEIG